ncbi:MAG: hypothetical protein ACRDS9_26425, partial [Pseudonocardiaceae bacterium]
AYSAMSESVSARINETVLVILFLSWVWGSVFILWRRTVVVQQLLDAQRRLTPKLPSNLPRLRARPVEMDYNSTGAIHRHHPTGH